MKEKKRVTVLSRNKVLSAIFESVEQCRIGNCKNINPLDNARKLLKKDLDHESVNNAAVYKSISRTFNDLLSKGYLSVIFGEKLQKKILCITPIKEMNTCPVKTHVVSHLIFLKKIQQRFTVLIKKNFSLSSFLMKSVILFLLPEMRLKTNAVTIQEH